MKSEKNSFWSNLVLVFALMSVLWIVQFIQYFGVYDFSAYGNWPRHISGLKGIIFSPFIHGSFDHLISNTLPMMVLLTVLLNAYPGVALVVLVFVHLASGVLVWLFAPPDTVHIGISGIIYGIAAFLIASGLFRKDRVSITIAIFVGLIYGSMIWGFIPQPGISWQSHFFGAISGLIMAYVLRNINRPVPAGIELEPVEEDKHFFDTTESSKRTIQ